LNLRKISEEQELTVEIIESSFPNMKFVNANWEKYRLKMLQMGAIVEEWISGKGKTSPSVQGYIHPQSAVADIISTHEQVLKGQVYIGCKFPCKEEYKSRLTDLGFKIGQNLAKRGCIGFFSVDFVVVPTSDERQYDISAVEVNLRPGGTTHPFMTLKYLLNGKYDTEKGTFYGEYQENTPKYYIASDNLRSQKYEGLLPSDLMSIITTHQLQFNVNSGKGAVFHLIGALSEYGKCGVTCIGDSPEEAQNLYNKVVHTLDMETSRATDSFKQLILNLST